MSFVDDLRNARSGPTTLLHEFKTNYDPSKLRVHAFVEGYEDLVFYRPALQGAAGTRCRVFMYRCGNKKSVYEMFQKLSKEGTVNGTLFFVDKDLSDVLGEDWPTSERIYVTEFYSIENYFVCRAVFERVCFDLIRLSNFAFNFEPVFQHFEEQLARFNKLVLTIMAWVIVTRDEGLKPNVNNINLNDVFYFSSDCAIRHREGNRDCLARATGVTPPECLHVEVKRIRSRLACMDPRSVVRGKFAMWFLINFTEAAVQKLRMVAEEVGGTVGMKVNLNSQNPVEALIGRVPFPDSLRAFLDKHFPRQEALFAGAP